MKGFNIESFDVAQDKHRISNVEEYKTVQIREICGKT